MLHDDNQRRPQPANTSAVRHAEIHFERMAVTIDRQERETLERAGGGMKRKRPTRADCWRTKCISAPCQVRGERLFLPLDTVE